MGSSPIRVANYALVAQSVEQQTENLRVGGSIPPQGTFAVVAQLVECHLAKVDVAGPNPVYRSSLVPWPSGKAKVCKTFTPRFKSGWHLDAFGWTRILALCSENGVFFVLHTFANPKR